MNTVRDLHVSATTLRVFCRTEVNEKIIRPWTFSPGNSFYFCPVIPDLPFHSSVWIGAGKVFSNLLPREVLDAKEKALEILEIFCGLLLIIFRASGVRS